MKKNKIILSDNDAEMLSELINDAFHRGDDATDADEVLNRLGAPRQIVSKINKLVVELVLDINELTSSFDWNVFDRVSESRQKFKDFIDGVFELEDGEKFSDLF